jgi:hypothetical protein
VPTRKWWAATGGDWARGLGTVYAAEEIATLLTLLCGEVARRQFYDSGAAIG